MARIAKSGLEYFPFDIDFFQDIRIRKLIKRQGGKAVTVYTLLLCLIYKNGYYIQWDDELPFIGSEMSGFEEAYISEVIKICLSLGLFDKEIFDKEKVLTSKGIQVRYCNIQRQNKRIGRIDKYAIVDELNQSFKPSSSVEKIHTVKKSTPKHRATSHSEPPAEPAVPTPAPPPSPAPATSDDNTKWLVEFFADNNQENLQLLCKNFGLKPEDIDCLRKLADAVVAEWELSRTTHRDYNDWSRHLISSMRIKKRDSTNHPNNNQPEARAPKRPKSDVQRLNEATERRRKEEQRRTEELKGKSSAEILRQYRERNGLDPGKSIADSLDQSPNTT
ncbi:MULTISPECIES: DUF4373 domain-containing protein [Muribaculaceae]|uniref:DUF4373 domain-containing protein n=1 Tax=Muribaculaceae TaxID=2005473 RepID=UPI002649D6D9|nr:MULTISPECIES: DUF4373 domain-containing protein [Muribaculaceae]